jgi:hypothetical protein
LRAWPACVSGQRSRASSYEARDAKARTQRRAAPSGEILALATVELLIIDDFALEPMTREEASTSNQLFVERTGQPSTIITNNQDTSEWTPDSIVCPALSQRRRTNQALRPRCLPAASRGNAYPER